MGVGIWMVVGLIAILVLWIVAIYNGLIGSRNQIRNSWSQIEVQLVGGYVELGRDVADGFLELHQRPPNLFDLMVRERAGVHTADCLPLEELPDEFDEGEHQLRDRLLNVVRVGVPAQRRCAAGGALELVSKVVELVDLGNRDRAAARDDVLLGLSPLSRPARGRTRARPASGRSSALGH